VKYFFQAARSRNSGLGYFLQLLPFAENPGLKGVRIGSPSG
jgi:hypothetical protein